jgi:hypothetical protein
VVKLRGFARNNTPRSFHSEGSIVVGRLRFDLKRIFRTGCGATADDHNTRVDPFGRPDNKTKLPKHVKQVVPLCSCSLVVSGNKPYHITSTILVKVVDDFECPKERFTRTFPTGNELDTCWVRQDFILLRPGMYRYTFEILD